MSDEAKPALPRPEKKMTILEKLKQLDEDRAKLIGDAKAEALKKATAAIEDLNSLGFTYQLVEGEVRTRAPKSAGGEKKPRQKPEMCTACNFATTPGHDGRHKGHRLQETKKPFTAKELTEYGLTKKVAQA